MLLDGCLQKTPKSPGTSIELCCDSRKIIQKWRGGGWTHIDNMTSKHLKISNSSGVGWGGTKNQKIVNFCPKQTFLVVSTPNLYKFYHFFKILAEGVLVEWPPVAVGEPTWCWPV